MAKALKAGDAVSWKSHGSKARGKVIRTVTKPMTIRCHKIAALNDNPLYLVETDEGERAAHKLPALSKR